MDIFMLRFQSANDRLNRIIKRLNTDNLRQHQLHELTIATDAAYGGFNDVSSKLNDVLQKMRDRKFQLRADTKPIFDIVRSAAEKLEATLDKSFGTAMDSSRALCDLDVLGCQGAKVARSKLEEQVGECQKQLKEIEQQERSVRWSKLIDYEAKEQDELLSAYADLFAGLSLRWSHFDDGLCAFADDLIETCARTEENNIDLFSIPTRRESIMTKLERVMRLSCPDAALWELPLAANELWNIVIARDADVKNELEAELCQGEQAELFPVVAERLSDCFGAYCMGPAYGCATLLLRLKPTVATDRDRARRVLAMLQHANQNSFEKSWAHALAGLRSDWESAVGEALGQAHSAEAQKQDIRYAETLAATLKKPKRFRHVQFPMDLYPSIADLKKALISGELDGVNVVDTRHLLNAAWMARREKPDIEAQLRAHAAALRDRLPKKDPNKTAYGQAVAP